MIDFTRMSTHREKNDGNYEFELNNGQIIDLLSPNEKGEQKLTSKNGSEFEKPTGFVGSQETWNKYIQGHLNELTSDEINDISHFKTIEKEYREEESKNSYSQKQDEAAAANAYMCEIEQRKKEEIYKNEKENSESWKRINEEEDEEEQNNRICDIEESLEEDIKKLKKYLVNEFSLTKDLINFTKFIKNINEIKKEISELTPVWICLEEREYLINQLEKIKNKMHEEFVLIRQRNQEQQLIELIVENYSKTINEKPELIVINHKWEPSIRLEKLSNNKRQDKVEG